MCSSDYVCAGNRLVTQNMSVKPSMQHRVQESVNIAAEWTNNNDMKMNSEKSK